MNKIQIVRQSPQQINNNNRQASKHSEELMVFEPAPQFAPSFRQLQPHTRNSKIEVNTNKQSNSQHLKPPSPLILKMDIHSSSKEETAKKSSQTKYDALRDKSFQDKIKQNNSAVKKEGFPTKQEKKQSAPEPLQSSSEENSLTSNRVTGIIILFMMAGVVFVYGFVSEYAVVSSTSMPINFTTLTIFSNLFIVTAIFTVIGFGLLFVHFKRMSESAFFVSLFITSFTIIFSPIIQKLWYNIFITDFGSTTITSSSTASLLNLSFGGKNIYIDFYNLKFSLINAISQLVVILGLFGRLNAIQITLFSILYNFAWSVNHYLIINFQNRSPDTRFFDDYQIASVYLFAGCFGVVACLIIKKPIISQNFNHTNFSLMFSQLGTFFLFLSFCGITVMFSQKTTDWKNIRVYIWQQGFLNTFFALSASILSTYAFSVIFGDKIHLRQTLIGTITGAIIYGPIAQTCNNIGAAIACGIFSGFFSSFFYQKLFIQINKVRIYDSLGIILIVIVSLIGTFGVAPLVLYSYSHYGITLPTLPASSGTNGTMITSTTIVGYILQYVGITAGIGVGSGLILGGLLKLLDKFDADKVMDDKTFFTKNNGLRQMGDKQKSGTKSQLKQNIGKTEQDASIPHSNSGVGINEIAHNSQKQLRM